MKYHIPMPFIKKLQIKYKTDVYNSLYLHIYILPDICVSLC